MLILQRNVFSGIVDQAHTTVGMVATVIMEVYPTTNKAMLQVQVSLLTPKLLNPDYKTSMFRSIYSVKEAVNINKFDQKMGISF